MIHNIILRLNINRYYQTFINIDRYITLDEIERRELYDAIAKNLPDKIKIFLTASRTHQYQVQVNSMTIQETEDRQHLLARVQLTIKEPNNLTRRQQQNYIRDTFLHYFRSGPTGVFGPKIYYQHIPPANYNPDSYDQAVAEPKWENIILYVEPTPNTITGQNQYYAYVDHIE